MQVNTELPVIAPSLRTDGLPSPAVDQASVIKTSLKWIAVALGMIVVCIPAALCRLESRLSHRNEWFVFWGQAFSVVPGLPGKYLRKCFYHLTLKACSLDCEIGFLSYFNRAEAELGPRVYVGSGVTLGRVTLGAGSLIGTRVSLLNGGHQHYRRPDGRLAPCDWSALPWIHIGEETWVGEAAVIMADVGSHCIVAAGSVVSGPVADGCVVGGNPLRFIRKSVPCCAETAT